MVEQSPNIDHTEAQDADVQNESSDAADPSSSSNPGGEDTSEQHIDAYSKDYGNPDPKDSKNPDLSHDTVEVPPPLPPRPTQIESLNSSLTTPFGSLRVSKNSPRPQLLSHATTAVSLTEIHPEVSTSVPNTPSRAASSARESFGTDKKPEDSAEDSSSAKSVQSSAPISSITGDIESLFGEILENGDRSEWTDLDLTENQDDLFELSQREEQFESEFESEFQDLTNLKADGSNEEALNIAWRSKLKHFLIVSSAGKPIYSRHGDDVLVASSIGVIRTIISFYQDANDALKSFKAGDAHFVILPKGHLHLVAISRLDEHETQLRSQLDALYMQILSTLTLPVMERMFQNRPNTDLRRPLQGTEKLLSALADGFTRGSPSTLLSALECLPLRKAHRSTINNTMLAVRSPNLLYGLIVAGGRLASVLRPKKHSLHPGDLQLIFNMLFEAESIRNGGGENWIPLCLPGFNNKGYIYMYVSFLSASKNLEDESASRSTSPSGRDDEIAVLLISANKESFFELRSMRETLVARLRANGSLAYLQAAVMKGRPTCVDILKTTLQNSALQHFLYKSRSNVQFAMPSREPHYKSMLSWRRLMSLYGSLHGAVHARTSHLKLHHRRGQNNTALACVTPSFELYCVAAPGIGRAALVHAASGILRWIKSEEERVFIVGGAVF